MFAREKVRVDPAKTNAKKGKRGKNFKAAWETLLASQKGPDWRFASERRGRAPHVQWSDDDDDDDEWDSYDKFNSSLTPSASLNFSGSRSKSFESLWHSATERSLSNSFESHAIAVEDFELNTGQPPVPKELVRRILQGKYVNFQQLLPENRTVESGKNRKLIDETERIDDITKWVDCMAIYIAVYTTGHPNRSRDLLMYQRTVTKLYRQGQDKRSWQRYDVAFRRKASQNGIKDWNVVDENLWIMACSKEARRSVLCKACLSLAHDKESCPLNLKEKEERESKTARRW